MEELELDDGRRFMIWRKSFLGKKIKADELPIVIEIIDEKQNHGKL